MKVENPPLKAELDAALDWWWRAGVTHDFADDATDWLHKADADAAPRRNADSSNVDNTPDDAAQPPKTDLFAGAPPVDLEAFRRFWLEAPGLDTIGPRGRVAPQGPADAELMVIVIHPEDGDQERLLGGQQGRLLDQILAAMGLNRAQVYTATALPRHMPMPDTAALAENGFAQVTLHHIALAAPKRVLAFGTRILPFLGHELTKEFSNLREINQSGRCTPLLVSEGLDSMIGMPRLKARFWRRWIQWSANQ